MRRKRYIDWWLLIIIALLGTISVAGIFSAKALFPAEDWANQEIKQMLWFGVGSVVAFFMLWWGNDRLKQLSWPLYFIGIISLLGLYTPLGLNINNATRWYSIPGIGTLQPSEFVKIFVIIVLAKMAADHHEKFPKMTSANYRSLFFKMLIVAGIPAALIFQQPDTGLATVILISTLSIMLAAGIPFRYFFTVGGIAFGGVGAAVGLFVATQGKFYEAIPQIGYRIERIVNWLFPNGSVETAGDNYQLTQGMIAMGSGGLEGHGFQSSAVFIPEGQNDFIFSTISADFGFFIGLAVIILSFLLLVRIFIVLAKSKNKFNSYMAAGFIGMIAFQQMFNIGMTMGLMPVKGMTLPFISYGGTSLLSYFMVIGIMLSIYNENKRLEHSGFANINDVS
ncbi:MAG: FtsW/RodA/SpoVE family cell cycle protein [Culicoidibacterales bacterium]